jgi:glycerol-3-phosphate dehydrogenase
MPGSSAIMVPHTSDGRVMFAIPWHNHVVVGTTDTPIDEASLEPKPFEQEIEFILETAGKYLSRPPERSDLLSVFVGIRPLVKAGGAGSTAALSRDHTIHIDNSGLLTICGGKWTTYRHMSEETVDHAITLAKLDERPCLTKDLRIHGHREYAPEMGHMYVYGSDADAINQLAEKNKDLAEALDERLPYTKAELLWACRFEMARTPEDFLARRTRALFLDAAAALRMAPAVTRIMAAELQKDAVWEATELANFQDLAKQYMLNPVVAAN